MIYNRKIVNLLNGFKIFSINYLEEFKKKRMNNKVVFNIF